MGSGFAKKKKQAKLFQEQISKMQGDLKSKEVTGTAGNGLVTITLTGDNEMKKIQIKPECVDPEDVEGLQDLIKAAYKSANDQLQSDSGAAGMPSIPGMPDLSQFGL